MDNSAFHGPGGQQKAEFPEDADVCFAKISGGFDVLEAVLQLPLDPRGGVRMEQPVVIAKARVVSV